MAPVPAPRLQGPATAAPKILVYADMDGSSGVNNARQVLYPNPEYFASRHFITSHLNAAIRGHKAGGAGEIVVTDAHGSGNTEGPDILLEQMDSRATFLFRDTEYDPYIDILDSSYAAIVAVGMHARARTAGFMAHTVTLEPFYSVNGVRITESELIAISAARYGIPVIMVAGDDVLERQIHQAFPGVEYAVVKRAKGHADAELVPQEAVQSAIEKAARAAAEKVATYGPFAVTASYRFEVGYWNRRQPDLAMAVPGVTRVDSVTIGYTTTTFPEGYARSLQANQMARLDAMRWLVQAVQAMQARPDGTEIMGAYFDVFVGAWLEPEKLPKVAAAPEVKEEKKRFWGDT
ncbi:MAG: M55 family metallopeptidase [Gemmatimonadaceae bacterium]|nr:M55 family metallopeptidase [Gemmatimonadaceae bacterium]